jgi:DNA-binding beta-propeller fold protein YncE
MGIAVDSSNHVYVVDSGYDRVEKFTSSGIYLTQWGSSGSGNGQFGNPMGIAVDSSGNGIYVADAGYSRIEVFVNNANIVPPIFTNQPVSQTVPAGSDVTFSVGVVGTAPFSYQWSFNNVIMPGATNANLTLTNLSLSASGAYSVLVTNDSGSELSSAAVLAVLPESDYIAPTYLYEIDSSVTPGGFSPNFVALDSSNNVYVTDFINNRVDKFTGIGTYLTQWGSYGGGNGQFSNPYGIAVDNSNNVYVSDDFNDRVEKFTSSGNYLTQWGPLGTNNNLPNYSQAIAVDSSNNVYVSDDGNYRVEKFDSSGNYLMQWGSYGSDNGQFESPGGIAVDSSNNVYVADANNYRIEKFDSNGNYLTQWGSNGTNNGQFSNPHGIAVDGSNNVYVTDYGNNRIEKFASNGAYLTQWGNYGTNHGQFNHPAGIAVDGSGNIIYIADYGNSRIQIFVNNANLGPPIITNQPASQTVPAGINVTFNIGHIGAAPFFYQWSSNNVAVPGATNATFTLSNVNLAVSGSFYSVLVTNSFGSELGTNAVLTVVPALMTTQPASGLSASGAVLNGSANVGVESLVWFEWGTDTNYGNITGETVISGSNGSTNISVPLIGLPGNLYHYRMVAANDFGIVYGEDQSFTVGFAPMATTLDPVNGTNGATVEAVVNPEGWDTTVYFQWGTTSALTNTTPIINIGAGVTSLNVSNFIPGLSIPYKYRVVASNGLGWTFGELVYGDSGHAYLFSGSETNITLPPGTYIITAYGAAGGYASGDYRGFGMGGLGAEMSAEFNFPTSTTLTLLVGGFGGYYSNNRYGGGGGGGGSFVVEGSTPLIIAGGGGGGAVNEDTSPGAMDGGNGNVSVNGGAGGGNAGGLGGYGGSGGGGGGGTGFPGPFPTTIGGGGGGGGFTGDGGYGGGAGSGGGYPGYSFENGGNGASNVFSYGIGNGGFGGGGGGNSYHGNGYGGLGGGGGGYSGGGGGGGNGGYGNIYLGGGGGGGSIIDSSAIASLAEVSGIFSPDARYGYGEIIITLVPPAPVAIFTTNAAFGFTNGVFGFDVSGPSGSSVVIQASTDLQTWIPLQINLLGSGPLYFSDPQSTTNVQRFYRIQLSP